jgi:hypothetical protein
MNSSEIKLKIKGQGVFIFKNTDNSKKCSFLFLNKNNDNGINVAFTKTNVIVNKINNLTPLIDENNKEGLSDNSGAYYWFSLDSHNQILYAGIGEARLETIIYKYQFNFPEDDEKKFLESLTHIHIDNESTGITLLKLLKDPITNKIPLLVKNTDSLTMNDIARGDYLPKSNLSTIGQQLFDCVSGKNFILDDVDFPNFSKAIEYSIVNENGWCYQKLKSKSTEFNKDKPNILETYLRITIGRNNGESPGIPYVLEIWPVGHFSPIHNHGGANAIIRVLHGSINVKLFPYLCGQTDKVSSFSEKNFNKDDITWISPTLNQTHQLKNLEKNKDTCITIQCYLYDNQNKSHYDYFDYIDSNGNIQQYEPDSDMDFVDFKELMKKEWTNKPNKLSCIDYLTRFLIK